MPITINQPPNGTSLGPGIKIELSLDGQPTLPPGTRWRVSVADQDTPEASFYIEEFPYSGNDGWAFGFTGGTGRWVQPLPGATPNGSAARMLVELIGEGVTEPSLSQPVTWDTESGMPYVVGAAPGAAGGGLTPAQDTTLTEVHDAVIVQMGTPGNVLDIPIASLIAHPPLGLLEIDPYATGVTGAGILSPSLPGGELSYGLYWVFTSIPPELGYRIGLTNHYAQRMVQFRTVFEVGGNELIDEVLDADYERVIWLWRTPFPSRIEFSFLPGVTADIFGLNTILGPS